MSANANERTISTGLHGANHDRLRVLVMDVHLLSINTLVNLTKKKYEEFTVPRPCVLAACLQK